MRAGLLALAVFAAAGFSSGSAYAACTYSRYLPMGSHILALLVLLAGLGLMWLSYKKYNAPRAGDQTQQIGRDIGILCLFTLACCMVIISAGSLYMYRTLAAENCWAQPAAVVVPDAPLVAPAAPLNLNGPASTPPTVP